jgi:hypothetical protein
MIKELGTTEPFCCIRFQNQTPPYTLCTDAGLTITMFALHAVTRHPVLVKAEIISLHSQVSHPLSQPPLSTPQPRKPLTETHHPCPPVPDCYYL